MKSCLQAKSCKAACRTLADSEAAMKARHRSQKRLTPGMLKQIFDDCSELSGARDHLIVGIGPNGGARN